MIRLLFVLKLFVCALSTQNNVAWVLFIHSIDLHSCATNNPSMKGRRGEHTLLSFQLSIEHTVVALTSVMKHRCRVPRFRPGLYSSSDMPPYSSLVSPMNICRRDPSLLRAKSDNAAANTAESQSKPIQSSVWKKKEEKEAKGLAAHLCDSTPQ